MTLCERKPDWNQCEVMRGQRAQYARELEHCRHIRSVLLNAKILVYERRISEFFANNRQAFGFFATNIRQSAKEAQAGEWSLRKIEDPNSKSNTKAYRLQVGNEVFFFKQTGCDKEVGRWGPFELATLLDLHDAENEQMKVVRPRWAYSDGRTSYIIVDYIQVADNPAMQLGVSREFYYESMPAFETKAIKRGFWELSENFFYDSARGQVTYFDPYNANCEIENLRLLLGLAGAHPEYEVRTTIRTAALNAEK